MDKQKLVHNKVMDNETPVLREGKLAKIVQKVVEGKKERGVSFIGRIIKVKGAGENQTITLRQTLEGIEVDRIFPVMSPTISSIVLVEERISAAKKAKKKKSSKKK